MGGPGQGGTPGVMKAMTKLGDKFRELQSICEGEILQREKMILELRKELEKAREELIAAKSQQRAVRSEKCQGCIYKIADLRSLEEGEKGK